MGVINGSETREQEPCRRLVFVYGVLDSFPDLWEALPLVE